MELPRELMRPRIVLLGAGNVATHLLPGLARIGNLVQIYNRTESSARALVEGLRSVNTEAGISFTSRLDSLADADLYVISVKDDAIADILHDVPDNGALWVHTAGSVGMDVFSGHRKRFGILYPLQTFSKEASIDINHVPFLIEGNSQEVEALLQLYASIISDTVIKADSRQRREIHIAAVFASNFVNHLLGIAHSRLTSAGINPEILKPLVQATIDKAFSLSPISAQTGPARRNDTSVIQSHLKSLQGTEAEIYRLLTESIIKQYNAPI